MNAAPAVPRSLAGEHIEQSRGAAPGGPGRISPSRTAVAEEPGGVSPAEVLAAYSWSHRGRCLRCQENSRRVTLVATVRVPHASGAAIVYPLALCARCVLAQEERLEERAWGRGLPYAPGGIRPAR